MAMGGGWRADEIDLLQHFGHLGGTARREGNEGSMGAHARRLCRDASSSMANKNCCRASWDADWSCCAILAAEN